MTRFQKAKAYIYYFFVLLGVAFKDMFYKPDWKIEEEKNKKIKKRLNKEIAKSVRKEL